MSDWHLPECRGCGRPLGNDRVKVWVRTPIGITCVHTHAGCEEIAATALDGKVVPEPVSKVKGRQFPSLAPGPKPGWLR